MSVSVYCTCFKLPPRIHPVPNHCPASAKPKYGLSFQRLFHTFVLQSHLKTVGVIKMLNLINDQHKAQLSKLTSMLFAIFLILSPITMREEDCESVLGVVSENLMNV